MLLTTRCVPWEAFALFPQEICNEPRGRGRQQPSCVRSKLHTIPVSALFFVGKAVKLGNEHGRSAGPGTILEVDDEAL